jgi:hypothetical protein
MQRMCSFVAENSGFLQAKSRKTAAFSARRSLEF